MSNKSSTCSTKLQESGSLKHLCDPFQMYSLLLEVQDFEKRFVHAPEEDREALLEQHKTNTMQLCNSLQEKEWDDRQEGGIDSLDEQEIQELHLAIFILIQLSATCTHSNSVSLPLIRVSDEQCVMIMSVRKGKRLISRLLPFLPSLQAAAVVMAIARNLPALAKKDKQDQVTISKCNIIFTPKYRLFPETYLGPTVRTVFLHTCISIYPSLLCESSGRPHHSTWSKAASGVSLTHVKYVNKRLVCL